MRKEELVMVDKKLKVVIITGMSGAGKTVAVHSLEDLGYFVIDNMLPRLAERFVDVIEDSREFDKIAMVMDMRSRGFYDEVLPNFEKLKKFAKLIGAAAAGSRGAVDMGLIEKEYQIGQTGKTVSPRVYMAFGISGAIHHITGIENSKKIIAINTDENAPIFQNADVKIVQDAVKILDGLIEKLEN